MAESNSFLRKLQKLKLIKRKANASSGKSSSGYTVDSLDDNIGGSFDSMLIPRRKSVDRKAWSLALDAVTIHTSYGSLIETENDSICRSIEDLTGAETDRDDTTRPGSEECRVRSSTVGDAMQNGSARRTIQKSKSQPEGYDKESCNNHESCNEDPVSCHDLTGRASLLAKDLLFGIPAAPLRPPRKPVEKHSLKRATSTPNNIGKESTPKTIDQKRRTRASHILNAMNRMSVGPLSEDEENDTEPESEDSYMDWSDEDTSYGSTPSPSQKDVSDVYENMGFPEPCAIKGKAHRIAHELMTSEETYVKKLEILNKARNNTIGILGKDIAKEMFPYIEGIYSLHKDNLLPHLKERLQLWDSHQQIGDIMKTFSPFLKLYTDYVKNFDNAIKMVDSWSSKSSEFSMMIKTLPAMSNSTTMNLKLQIKSHMLEPVQRVPRYQLLLQQYSQEIEESSAERADLQVALTSVTQAAKHFEAMMKHGTMMIELLELQRQIDCPMSLISTGRRLVKQGKIGKVNAKTGKVVSRYLFLFNDLFLVCSEQPFFYIPGLHPKYKVRQLMEVDGMQIADGHNPDISAHTFLIKTKKKAIELAGSDENEKSEWEKILRKVVGDKMRLKLDRVNSRNKRRTMMLRADGPLGKEAPVWVHNSQVSMCMMCAATFRGLKKKHHCRACGAVVCNKCSSHTTTLEYDDNRDHRVCDECYLVLEENAITAKRDSNIKSRKRELCTYSGYLLSSEDFGQKWHKRWLELQEGGHLYWYKAQQDICSESHVELKWCKTEVCTESASGVKFIRLNAKCDKCYFLKDDSFERLQRWLDALKSST